MSELRSEPWDRAATLVGIWNEQGVEAMAERFWHPDMVWQEAIRFPDGALRHGRDACVRRMAERLSLLGEVTLELVDAEAAGDRTLVEIIVRGAGTERVAPTEMREFFVFRVVDGLTIDLREFLDRDEALIELHAA